MGFTGGLFYKNYVHHVWWRGVRLGAIYFQGTNYKLPMIT